MDLPTKKKIVAELAIKVARLTLDGEPERARQVLEDVDQGLSELIHRKQSGPTEEAPR